MPQSNQPYLAAFSQADITAYEEGIQLMGWGITTNTADTVAEPLIARCVAVHEPQSTTNMVFVCADLCIITHLVRERVMARVLASAPSHLELRDEQVMITATHTHSAPSGITDYLFYSLSGPGYSEQTTAGVVDGIATAILDALERIEPVEIRAGATTVPRRTPIAFNRSMEAWRQNPESDQSASPEDATYRTMDILRFDSLEGAHVGTLTFFATHSTSVHSDHRVIHPDHKGLAAMAFTRLLAEAGVSGPNNAIFAQGAAGDVTPNFRPCRSRSLTIGAYDDDFRSVQFIADAQARVAYRGWAELSEASPLPVQPITARLAQVDFREFPIDEEFAGSAGLTSATPIMGLGFIEGTREGPGPLLATAPAFRRITRSLLDRVRARSGGGEPGLNDAQRHANKLPFLEVGRGAAGRAFGFIPLLGLPLPSFLDAVVARYMHFRRNGGVDGGPWITCVTSTHFLQLGGFNVLGISGEPTTVAGERLRQTVRHALGEPDAQVVVAGYANSYNSYVTTPEEYDRQDYEGASTLFGRMTLPAYQSVTDSLVRSSSDMSARPPRHPRWRTRREVLDARSFSDAIKARVP